MTDKDRLEFMALLGEFHAREMRYLSDHLLRNFRGEVDVVSGKLDRLRERVEVLEGAEGKQG